VRAKRALMVVSAAVATATLGAGTARAGCAAEVEVALPRAGIQEGGRWHARLRVLQHGTTPLEGATPHVTIAEQATGATRTFHAAATGEVGLYAARVTFPRAGVWRVAAYDGFTARDGSWSCARTHFLGTVTVAGPEMDGGGGAAARAKADSGWALDAAVGLGAFAAALAGAALVARRRRGAARGSLR
jgi:hypothetical protein